MRSAGVTWTSGMARGVTGLWRLRVPRAALRIGLRAQTLIGLARADFRNALRVRHLEALLGFEPDN